MTEQEFTFNETAKAFFSEWLSDLLPIANGRVHGAPKLPENEAIFIVDMGAKRDKYGLDKLYCSEKQYTWMQTIHRRVFEEE